MNKSVAVGAAATQAPCQVGPGLGGPDIGCYNESHIPDPNAINMGGWPAENQKQ